MKRLVLAALAGVFSVSGLTGCFSTVRHVQKVLPAMMYRTAEVGVLEKEISDRDAAIKTLNASVLVTASTGGGRTGKVKTYTSFRGYIFVQKPRNLRMILKLPVLGSEAADMVSDGKSFTLLIPPRSLAYTGTNQVTKPSKNGLENLRPAVIFDSVLVPGVSPEGEYVTLTESQRVLQPAHGRKDAVQEPDYDLAVARVKSGNLLQLERVIHISRVDMLPFQQDIYDDEGRVVTQATYENYQPTGTGTEPFPRTITITRPLDEYTLKVEITKLVLNDTFEADQFEAPKIPSTYRIERMP